MDETAVHKPGKITIQVIILLVFVVITRAIDGFYAIYDRNPSGAFVLLSYLGLFWLIGDWFMRDSRKNRVDWAFDMGLFLYISWPVFIPFYLFKTRGFKKAFFITFGFIALYLGVYYLSYYLFYFVMP